MSIKLALKILPLTLVLGTAACSGGSNLVSPTTAAPATSSEMFAGTLTPNGAKSEPFTVAGPGPVRATITKLEPDATILVGLSLGTWNGSACTAVVSDDKATQGTAVTAQSSSAGRLCVRISDATGTLVESTDYELTVVHP